MLTIHMLAAMLCLVKPEIGSGSWGPRECETRAEEFINAGLETHTDPLLLVSISIYECDLEAFKDVLYYDSRGITARDICPTGLHITSNLSQTRGGMSRATVLYKSGQLLNTYKTYHRKHCKHAKHNYLQHYNVGYQHLDNGYAVNVLEIYTSLKSGKSNLKRVSPRTKEIASNIRRSLGYVHNKDILKGCKPRNSCIIASRK